MARGATISTVGEAAGRAGLTLRGGPEPLWRMPARRPPLPGWAFPDPAGADDSGLVGFGADLEPGTLLGAYEQSLFPMPVSVGRGRRALGWWSPDPRGVLPLGGLVVSRSLRRSCRRFEVRVDTAFVDVMQHCADPHRPHGWIDAGFVRAYTEMHELGYAHSVEAWTPEGELAGGLYGIAVGGFFAGESMFYRVPDASKVALVGLVERMVSWGYRLLDVQWVTPHLATLGAVEVPADEYRERLRAALDVVPTGPG